MSDVRFSEVQLLNLSALITLRDSIQRDVISACCTFGLSAEQARCFGTLTLDQILSIVINVGQECLFLPRQDLAALVALPAALTGPIASVRPPHKTAPNTPGPSRPVQPSEWAKDR